MMAEVDGEIRERGADEEESFIFVEDCIIQ